MRTSLSFAVTGLASLFVGACADAPAPTIIDAPLVVLDAAKACKTLYAGQSIDVGTVCVSVDNTVDTSTTCGEGAKGVARVTYATKDGWTLVETHLAAGDSFTDIPVNKNGNPQIGHFPYGASGLDGATSYQVDVPLCEFGLDAALEECSQKAYFAAHAVVQKAKGDGTFQTETGWGDGERLVKKGSWAMFFTLDFTCVENSTEPVDDDECESAWAYGGSLATSFRSIENVGDNWGWTNGVYTTSGSYTLDLYAAAGNFPESGTLVGTVTLTYTGDAATVTFQTEGPFTLTETHFYVGAARLPTNNAGKETFAPGQYGNTASFGEGVTTMTKTVSAPEGGIHLVAHGVVCAPKSAWGDSEDMSSGPVE